MTRELTVEEAIQYLLRRDQKLAKHLGIAANVTLEHTAVLMEKLADVLTDEMKKSMVQTVRREKHLHDLIVLHHRMIKKANSNLTDLEEHVSQLQSQDEWNKVCDELNRPDLKAVYVR